MKVDSIQAGSTEIAEIISDDIVIKNAQDALDLIVNISCEHIVLHEHNFAKQFFDLSSGLAGEVLLKFTNYRVKLAVVGDFEKYTSKSLQAFIYESNKHGDYLFLPTLDAVIERWKA